MTAPRDPRTNPQPGDEWSRGGTLVAKVAGVSEDNVGLLLNHKDNPDSSGKMWLWPKDEWLTGTTKWTVLRVAGEPDSPLVARPPQEQPDEPPMSFGLYQRLAKSTAIYPLNMKVAYPALGLCGEAGEVAELVKKSIRDNKPLDKDLLTKEIGDVLWYAANLAHDAGISLDDVAAVNIAKLKSRAERGVLGGSGDNR